MNLKRRVSDLEQRAGMVAETVTLLDGTTYTFCADERVALLCPFFEGEDHELPSILPRIDLEASPGLRELVALIDACTGDAEETSL